MNHLQRALTHRSASRTNNEQLEFLGDSVLGMVVATKLHALYPDHPEGFLAQTKARLVNTDALHRCALRINLAPRLILGRSEECSGGRSKRNILADAVEALIAAIYLDKGYDAAAQWIERNILIEL